jgi:ATP-dependent Clp protease adaptor protein ClpS
MVKIECMEEKESGSDSSDDQNQGEMDSQVATEEKVETKPPPLYQVVLINDDYTPMDFVVWILRSIFHKPEQEATLLMLDVHRKGRGICGVFPYDVAQTKVVQVRTIAKKYEHPLECVMEKV